MQRVKDYRYFLILVFLFSFIYPPAAIIESLAVKSGWHWTAIIANAAMIFAGYMVSLISSYNKNTGVIDNKRKNAVFVNILYALSFCIPFAAAAVFYYRLSPAFYAVTFLVFYICGCIAYFTDFYDLFNVGVIRGGTISLAVSLFCSMSFEKSLALKNIILIFIYLFIFVILVLLNFNALEMTFSNPQSRKSLSFIDIKLHNLSIVFAFFLLIFALLNIEKILSFILYAPFILASYLFTKIRLSRGYNVKDIASDRKNPELLDINTGNPIIRIVISVLFLALIVFILYKGRHAISKFYNKMLNLVKKMIFKFSPKQTDENPPLEYFDNIEVTETRSFLGKKTEKKKLPARSLKKLKKITDPSSKIKYIYGLLLDYLISKKVSINKSDTADEISVKAERLMNFGGKFKKVTALYTKTRYGMYIPDNNDVKSCENDLNYILKSKSN